MSVKLRVLFAPESISLVTPTPANTPPTSEKPNPSNAPHLKTANAFTSGLYKNSIFAHDATCHALNAERGKTHSILIMLVEYVPSSSGIDVLDRDEQIGIINRWTYPSSAPLEERSEKEEQAQTFHLGAVKVQRSTGRRWFAAYGRYSKYREPQKLRDMSDEHRTHFHGYFPSSSL
ncbi:hypothetical protein VNI00_011203 [Paramarasmius palmivorus]|uniref:Uncharacterized protein n=1 Tax=Paramarasmius palmivorus TaxID=297713 RepID=A0AAW0CEA7_9AGAR